MGKKRRSRNKYLLNIHLGFSGGLVVKNPPASAGDTEMRVPSLGQEGPLEKEMVTHSSILIWKNPMDRGAWLVTVHRVTGSQARLSN